MSVRWSPGTVRHRHPLAAPFRLIAGTIVIDVRIDGRPVTAMVDTGLPMSLVRPGLAASLGLVRQRGATFRSEHGAAEAQLAGPAVLSVGAWTQMLPSVIVAPAPFLAQAGVGADVVIGQDVLGSAPVDIDFERGHIRTLDGPVPPVPGFSRVGMGIDGGRRLTVLADLPGIGPVPAIVDLGSNAALMMDPGFARRHRLTDHVATSSGLIATLGGLSETLAFSLPSLTIGGLPVADIPVDVLPRWSSPQPINLGMEVLRRFRLVLDLAGEALWMRPIRGAAFDRELSGVLAAHQGDWLEVVHVARRSPAEAAGLGRGARIVSIDGASIDARYFTSGLWRWRYGPPGRSVAIGLGERTVALRLARYY